MITFKNAKEKNGKLRYCTSESILLTSVMIFLQTLDFPEFVPPTTPMMYGFGLVPFGR